jgi:putative membrane protein
MISPLNHLAIALILLIALQHVGLFILESFLWQKSIGMKVFRMDQKKAELTAPLAANQGVYNAFLAAGLLWGLLTALGGGLGYVEFSRSIVRFFLSCVVIAGIVGGMTVNRRIFFIQGLPAILALLVIGVAAAAA